MITCSLELHVEPLQFTFTIIICYFIFQNREMFSSSDTDEDVPSTMQKGRIANKRYLVESSSSSGSEVEENTTTSTNNTTATTTTTTPTTSSTNVEGEEPIKSEEAIKSKRGRPKKDNVVKKKTPKKTTTDKKKNKTPSAPKKSKQVNKKTKSATTATKKPRRKLLTAIEKQAKAFLDIEARECNPQADEKEEEGEVEGIVDDNDDLIANPDDNLFLQDILNGTEFKSSMCCGLSIDTKMDKLSHWLSPDGCKAHTMPEIYIINELTKAWIVGAGYEIVEGEEREEKEAKKFKEKQREQLSTRLETLSELVALYKQELEKKFEGIQLALHDINVAFLIQKN